MELGVVCRLTGRSGPHSSGNQTWVYARKSQDGTTEVFTYTRDTRVEVPLFAIGVGGDVCEPYVMTQTVGARRVDSKECPEFWCCVPACAMPDGC